jgi:hypothetical protein
LNEKIAKPLRLLTLLYVKRKGGINMPPGWKVSEAGCTTLYCVNLVGWNVDHSEASLIIVGVLDRLPDFQLKGQEGKSVSYHIGISRVSGQSPPQPVHPLERGFNQFLFCLASGFSDINPNMWIFKIAFL